MVYAQDTENIKIHHALGFLSVMFDKGVEYLTTKSGKHELTIVLYIPPYPYEHKNLLVIKYTIGIFTIRLPKIKISKV